MNGFSRCVTPPDKEITMPELELIGAAPSNYVWVYFERHVARKSVQAAAPTWFPGQARSERAA
jgi:hypothetical protein